MIVFVVLMILWLFWGGWTMDRQRPFMLGGTLIPWICVLIVFLFTVGAFGPPSRDVPGPAPAQHW
jgi:hypothetical protein